MAYEALAKYYDELMDDVDYEKWSRYIISLLNKFNKNLTHESTILDIACGTGEMTCKLAKKLECEIFAVDINVNMLEVAMLKARENNLDIKFFCHDMTDFKAGKTVDAVVCTCDGINYVEPQKVLELFKNVYKSLNNGCIFLFDISSAYKLRTLLGDNTIAEDRGNMAFIWENTLYEDCVQMDISVFTHIKDNFFIKEEEQQLQYIYEKDEIINLLYDAGFSDIKAYEFDTFKAAKYKSERIQFLARK